MPEPDPDAIDYYARIGVRPEADHETIERRRKQADRRFSPMGSSPDADEKRHMRINEASTVLEDADRRRRYDSLYESLGPINGTLAFETLSTDVIDAVRDSERLSAHLRGFIEVLGPEVGSRQFTRYYDRLETPVPDAIDSTALPNGYSVADTGFGIAAWSWQQADRPCSFSLWVTGGQQLWRTAVLEPESVDQLVGDLRASGPAAVPDSAGDASSDPSLDHSDGVSSDGTPTTQLSLGHPSSAVVDRLEDDQSFPPMAETASWASTPVDRLRRVVSYVVATGGWAVGTAVGSIGGGVVGSLLAAVAFLPLLAVTLVVQSSLPELSIAGLPLVDPASPVTSLGLFHYLVVGVAATTAAWVTGRLLARIQRRRAASLPRDAWLVFGSGLLALAGALFLGIGQSELSQWPGLALTAVLAAFTFQASMDVGAPRPLARLCRSVATLSFALAGAVASLAVLALVAANASSSAFETVAAVAVTVPVVDPTLFSPANAELVVVGFAALAIVPLALTTLYSLAYALESAVLRVRSYAFRSR